MEVHPEDNLFFYNLTLKKQSNYIHSCIGHFVDPSKSNALNVLTQRSRTEKSKKSRKELQLCLATETHIELYDVEEGTLKQLALIPIFAIITGIETINMDNAPYSFLAITSDSGVLTISKFVNTSSDIHLKTLCNEPLTRSGIRRLSPISYLNIDPQGRCILLSAMERGKLCFLIDYQDDEFRISSPLEVNRSGMITLQETSCDVQYDNPCFATLEIDTMRNNDYHLIFYVLDLSLNHIVKKSDYKIRPNANFLMNLPNLAKYGIRTKINDTSEDQHDEAADDVNPFVIIGYDNFILVKDMSGYYSIKVQIPKRENNENTTIIAYALQSLKKDFFILLQSNYGDLFKLTIIPNKSDRNRPVVSIGYFDSIYQSEKLHIFKNGYLFTNSEFGSNYLYQFESLGDDNDELNSTSSLDPELSKNFQSKDNLQNLSIASVQDNLNPVLSTRVTNDSPLSIIYHTNDTLKSLQNGTRFKSIISTPLPKAADKLWTVRLSGEKHHKLLFLSFEKSTMILNADDDSIEELRIDDNPFNLKGDSSIFVSSIGEKSIIQACRNEMRQIFVKDDTTFISKLEWYPPAGIYIVAASCTKTQVALALSNCEIVYFEVNLESHTDTLSELQVRAEMDEPITCISLSNTKRSNFLAVGSKDSTVKILSLSKSDSDNFMEVVSIQALMTHAYDLKFVQGTELHLHIGLNNGVYLRSKVNQHDARIYDVRTKYLGPTPISVSVLPSINLKLSDEDDNEDFVYSSDEDEKEEDNNNLDSCVVIHSSSTWISYEIDSLFYIRPVLLDGTKKLNVISEFVTESMKNNGCCALNSSGSLLIGKFTDFCSDKKWFNLKYNGVIRDTVPSGKIEDVKSNNHNSRKESSESEEEEEDADEEDRLPKRLYSNRVILSHPSKNDLSFTVSNFTSKKSCMVSAFNGKGLLVQSESKNKFQCLDGVTCITGVVSKLTSNSYYLVISSKEGKLFTYEIIISKSKEENEEMFNLRFIHSTVIDDQANAILSFSDKVLVPVFGNLVLFGMGKKQLLIKSVSKTPPSITKITALASWKDKRIAVGDIRESVTIFAFNQSENVFAPIADDITKRHVISVEFLDECTVIGGDKFGNIWTLRISSENNRTVVKNPEKIWNRPNQLLRNKVPNIMECPFKLKLTNHTFVNDIPMQFKIVESSQISDRPVVLYVGLQGTIGLLIPLLSKAQISDLSSIESTMNQIDELFYLAQEENNNNNLEMNQEDREFSSEMSKASKLHKANAEILPEGAYSIVNRDYKSYRSYYAPTKNIIDGDICETFLRLTNTEQLFVCKHIKKFQVADVIKQVNEMRTGYI